MFFHQSDPPVGHAAQRSSSSSHLTYLDLLKRLALGFERRGLASISEAAKVREARCLKVNRICARRACLCSRRHVTPVHPLPWVVSRSGTAINNIVCAHYRLVCALPCLFTTFLRVSMNSNAHMTRENESMCGPFLSCVSCVFQ